MKLFYYQTPDALYINLAAAPGADSQEIADGVIVDFDQTGRIVGIDIQHASERTDLTELSATHLPLSRKVA